MHFFFSTYWPGLLPDLRLFLPQTQENKQKMLRNGTFVFPRESQVAHNSGDIPF